MISGFVEAGDRGDKGPCLAAQQSPRVAVDGGSVADAGTVGMQLVMDRPHCTFPMFPS